MVSLLRGIPGIVGSHSWIILIETFISHLILGEPGNDCCKNYRPKEISSHPSLSWVKRIFKGLDEIMAKTKVEGEWKVLEKYESYRIGLTQKLQTFFLIFTISKIVVRSEKYFWRDIAVILTQLYKTTDSEYRSSKSFV